MWGDRFLREFGSVPTETWVAAITRLTDEQVAACLKGLADKGSPHPCSLPEFVAAGKPETGSPRYLGVPTTPEALRLAAPPRCIRDIDALRKALR